MKVLHIIPSIGPLRGGPSVAAVAMCRALVAAGVECHLVCTNDNADSLLDVPIGEWTMHEDVRTWFFPRFSPRWRTLREFQIGTGFCRWLTRHVHNYDLLHIHALFSYLPSVAMSIARRQGVPYVLRPLGILESYSLGRSAWKKRVFLALRESTNIRNASAIHLTSLHEDKASIIPSLAPRWIIPLGVEVPDCMTTVGPGDPPQILFLSRWHEKKRIEQLIEALSRLQDLDWRLVLAGSGEPELTRRIHVLVQKYHLKNRILFPGFVTGEAKWKLLREADLFVLPSASENFGIAVAEALAVGVPAIVSSQVALAEEIEVARAGWLCGNDVAALATCLRTVLSDRTEWKQRGEAARTLALQRFTWASCAQTLVEKYCGVLSAKRRGMKLGVFR